MELYHYCLQYNEWQDELKYKCDTVRSIEITDMPTVHNNSDATQNLAMRRAELSNKCKLIEDTAGCLSKELLYMKFLQGIPVAGAIGGAYDAIYMKLIAEYSELKYRRRFYEKRK